MSRNKMILLPKFDVEETLKTIDKMKPTLFPGAPTMYIGLLNHPDLEKYDLSSIKACLSGSAPLPVDIQEKFEAITGGKLVEGYGLTETSPVIAVNKMEKGMFGIGTIGAPLRGLDVKIAEDGEIIVKGASVFKEYYKDEEKTREAFTDEGYFKTGDIGELKDGLLKITDRKKEMFKTSGGKYIAPQVIENMFKSSQFIEQMIVVGEGEKMPCAIIQPNFEVAKNYLIQNQIQVPETNEELIKNELILKEIAKDVELMNKNLGNWEQIKKFELVPDEWTVETGLITPTLKLKRKVIMEKYSDIYSRLYQ